MLANHICIFDLFAFFYTIYMSDISNIYAQMELHSCYDLFYFRDRATIYDRVAWLHDHSCMTCITMISG